jgi:hypothetical protein
VGLHNAPRRCPLASTAPQQITEAARSRPSPPPRPASVCAAPAPAAARCSASTPPPPPPRPPALTRRPHPSAWHWVSVGAAEPRGTAPHSHPAPHTAGTPTCAAAARRSAVTSSVSVMPCQKTAVIEAPCAPKPLAGAEQWRARRLTHLLLPPQLVVVAHLERANLIRPRQRRRRRRRKQHRVVALRADHPHRMQGVLVPPADLDVPWAARTAQARPPAPSGTQRSSCRLHPVITEHGCWLASDRCHVHRARYGCG